MTGGTPLFATTSLISLRGLAGALLLLMLVAFIVIEAFGQERPAPYSTLAETVIVTEPARAHPNLN